MAVFVSQRRAGDAVLQKSDVRRVAQRMLDALDLADAELSILLTGDAQIRILNRLYRAKDRPTDVLAFPLDATSYRKKRIVGSSGLLLGDVVISLETALRQARSRKRELAFEVDFLLAHGLLHLLGFDHDTKLKKREMDGMTRRLVKAAARDEQKRSPRRMSRRSSGG